MSTKAKKTEIDGSDVDLAARAAARIMNVKKISRLLSWLRKGYIRGLRGSFVKKAWAAVRFVWRTQLDWRRQQAALARQSLATA